MQKLIIKKNDAFRPAVNDRINISDMFYEQYINAYKILNEILFTDSINDNDTQSEEIINSEYKNNIIAFCGERGDGKTSAMLTFANTLYSGRFESEENNQEKKTYININQYFTKPIVIDPSMFDDVHNIIDIVLANLYQRFKDLCDNDNSRIDYDRKDDIYDRQELFNCFEKVYKCISLIANPDKIKEQEYDYDGNIGKLSRLGESTRLKKNLRKLIDKYLAFEIDHNSKIRDKYRDRCLVIAIDDLDLCNGNAYKMAEQIRKYLIIPNVIIVMAIKIDQLEMGVVETNLRSYSSLFKDYKYYDINEQSMIMAEKYVDKLIPSVHRVYMPKIKDVNNVTVVVDENKELYGTEKNVNDQIIDLIRKKTGMIFLTKEKGKNVIVPDSLREFVNMWNMLNSLTDIDSKDISGEITFQNINIFMEYILNIIVGKLPPNIANEIKDMDLNNDDDICSKTVRLLRAVFDKTDKKYEISLELRSLEEI